jgi:glycosyl hydrolase family 16
MKRNALLLFAAVLMAVDLVRIAAVSDSASAGGASMPTSAPGSPWKLKFSTSFYVNAPLGSFSRCDASTSICYGLPKSLQSKWFAYPDGWPDTATQNGQAIHGYYSPSTTTWIADHVLNIRMWRGGTTVHSCALLPKVAMGMTYGKFVERFRVLNANAGFKSAHLLWPVRDGRHREVDYPEAAWGHQMIHAYVHSNSEQKQRFSAHAKMNSTWHTSKIEWTPTRLSFYLDGRRIGVTARGVPRISMDWVLQNETELADAVPPVNSSSTMQISLVAVYSYQGT